MSAVHHSGDCFVSFEDFAIIGSQWLNGYSWNDLNTLSIQWLTTDPCVPEDMVYIPDGTFQMGDSFNEGFLDELPVHAVAIDAFFMGKYEITNKEYCAFLNSAIGNSVYVYDGVVYGSGNNQPFCDTHSYNSISQIDYLGSVFSICAKGGRDMSGDPMVQVSWFGAAAYCNWRSSEEYKEQCYNLSTWTCDFNKKGYRLATEAEWEYAARGGLSGNRFPWGDMIPHSQANYWSSASYAYDMGPLRDFHPLWDDIYPYTSPIGFFDGTMKYKADYNWPGSATSYQTTTGVTNYGNYDMAGNVWEWCNDLWDSSYYDWCKNNWGEPCQNPTGPTSGTYRVLRGGCWNYGAIFCRVAFRGYSDPNSRHHDGGLRIVLNLE